MITWVLCIHIWRTTNVHHYTVLFVDDQALHYKKHPLMSSYIIIPRAHQQTSQRSTHHNPPMQNNRINHMCDRSAEIVFITSTHDALSFTVTITRHKAAHHLRLFSIPHGEYKDDIRTAQLSQYFRGTKTRYRIGTTLEVIMSYIINPSSIFSRIMSQYCMASEQHYLCHLRLILSEIILQYYRTFGQHSQPYFMVIFRCIMMHYRMAFERHSRSYLRLIFRCIMTHYCMEVEQHSTYYLLLVSCTISGLRRVYVQCMQLRSILSHQTRPDVIHHPRTIYLRNRT
eukprot:941520_1